MKLEIIKLNVHIFDTNKINTILNFIKKYIAMCYISIEIYTWEFFIIYFLN